MTETRQLIPTDPNNLSWAQDDSGYGARLLGKMGWKRGAGLGKREHGSTECIKPKLRTDFKGIGAEVTDSRASSLVEHSQIYEQALKNLGDLVSVKSKSKDKGKKKGKKDELSKKNSDCKEAPVVKGRALHRSKYIKNKQLNMYSEESLRQILGK